MNPDSAVEDLRRKIAEPADAAPYTKQQLQARIDLNPSLNKLAAEIWREKAAAAAHLVSVSEAGSSRTQSDIYKNALAMAAMYDSLDREEETIVLDGSSAFTTEIRRA